MQPLQNGDAVPHFVVRGRDGGRVDYSTIWQRRNIVLVATDSDIEDEQYLRELLQREAAFDEHESTVVVTHDQIPGLATPGLIVADRWGEIVHLVTPKTVTELPSPDTLLQWVEAIEHRCPECEGEAR
jgi:hypothetical protein